MILAILISFIGGCIFTIVLIALLRANDNPVDEEILANGIIHRDNELKVLNELLEKQDKTIYNQKLKINELLKVNNELREEYTNQQTRSN